MGKTIKQKIATGIVLVAGGLGSLINGGCQTTPAQNMAVSGVSAQHMAATNPNLSYQQRQSLNSMGGLMGVLAQQEAMKEAAEAGKSETVVNVNVPQQQNYQQEEERIYTNNRGSQPYQPKLTRSDGGVFLINENGNKYYYVGRLNNETDTEYVFDRGKIVKKTSVLKIEFNKNGERILDVSREEILNPDYRIFPDTE